MKSTEGKRNINALYICVQHNEARYPFGAYSSGIDVQLFIVMRRKPICKLHFDVSKLMIFFQTNIGWLKNPLARQPARRGGLRLAELNWSPDVLIGPNRQIRHEMLVPFHSSLPDLARGGNAASQCSRRGYMGCIDSLKKRLSEINKGKWVIVLHRRNLICCMYCGLEFHSVQ